jgi:hypothetical protein
MTFDFDLITVDELDKSLSAGRFSNEVRAILAKVTGQTVEEVNALPVGQYKKLVANFVKAAYSPVEADPN